MIDKLTELLRLNGIDPGKPTEAEQRLDDIESALMELAKMIVGGEE